MSIWGLFSLIGGFSIGVIIGFIFRKIRNKK